MKVAICIELTDGNQRFSDTFGSSDQFLIYDLEKKTLRDTFYNHFKSSPTAEIFCAQFLIKEGVNAVVCRKCGNDAKNLFSEANIEIIENIGLRPTEFLNILFAKYSNSKSIAI